MTHHNTGGGPYLKEGDQEGLTRKSKLGIPNFTAEYKPGPPFSGGSCLGKSAPPLHQWWPSPPHQLPLTRQSVSLSSARRSYRYPQAFGPAWSLPMTSTWTSSSQLALGWPKKVRQGDVTMRQSSVNFNGALFHMFSSATHKGMHLCKRGGMRSWTLVSVADVPSYIVLRSVRLD